MFNKCVYIYFILNCSVLVFYFIYVNILIYVYYISNNITTILNTTNISFHVIFQFLTVNSKKKIDF